MKFVIFKSESRFNPVKVNPSERHIKMVFDKLHKMHTRMLLNPFFDLTWVKDGSAMTLHEMSVYTGADEDDEEVSSGSGSSRSSNASMDDERASQPGLSVSKYQAKHFSAKRHSKECLAQFRAKVDSYIAEEDKNMRKMLS